VHDSLVDSFYVLEGTLAVVVEHEEIELAAGGFACAPPGTRHAFANRSDPRVRFLNINAPGGFEDSIRELAAAAGEAQLTGERIGEIASPHDVPVVE
jgi:mannose-6-phosphate isomerase-like protein (cupin superfamily)